MTKNIIIQYKKSFEYINESKRYFLIIAVLFLIFVFIGFSFPIFFTEFIKEFIRSVLERTQNLGLLEMILFIIVNNVMSSFFAMLFGFFLGFAPLLSAMFNGYVIGFVAREVSSANGAVVLWRLLPHGIFELPALFISLGLGLKIGMFIFAKNWRKQFFYDMQNSLLTFIFVVLPLLIIAGVIEGGLIVIGG